MKWRISARTCLAASLLTLSIITTADARTITGYADDPVTTVPQPTQYDYDDPNTNNSAKIPYEHRDSNTSDYTYVEAERPLVRNPPGRDNLDRLTLAEYSIDESNEAFTMGCCR